MTGANKAVVLDCDNVQIGDDLLFAAGRRDDVLLICSSLSSEPRYIDPQAAKLYRVFPCAPWRMPGMNNALVNDCGSVQIVDDLFFYFRTSGQRPTLVKITLENFNYFKLTPLLWRGQGEVKQASR